MDKSELASNDIEKLAASLREKFETMYPLSEECCIYRVPTHIRFSNDIAYTPRMVSIGPLHHGRQDLKAMEEHQLRYLHDFLQRTMVSMEDYLVFIRDKEAKLRNSYAETIGIGSDIFLKMILVDAVFLIEVLLRYTVHEFRSSGDRIFSKPWMINGLGPDFWLLENQLPLFILKELFDKAKSAMYSASYEGLSLSKLTSEFFKELLGCLLIEENLLAIHFSEAEHFLDLIRLCLQPPQFRDKIVLKTLNTRSVMELYQAGVKFKLGSRKNLLDIRFNNGILEIPNLKVNYYTRGYFRNLLAFEALHCGTRCINDYVLMINCLVNTTKDVELLIQKEIIENWIWDSEAVTTVFHNLNKGATPCPADFQYSILVEDLNVYCKSPWHKWKANLKQNYFNTPWASISVIAAVVLLVLTFIQSVCSILAL